MAAVLVQSDTDTGAATTSLVGAFPGAVTAGNKMIAYLTARVASVVITPPTGWNLISQYVSNPGSYLYYRDVVAGDGQNYTWTLGTSGDHSLAVQEWSGLTTGTADTSNPYSGAAALTATFLMPFPLSGQPSLVVSGLSRGNGTDGGETMDVGTIDHQVGKLLFGHKTVTVTTAPSVTWSWGSSRAWSGVLATWQITSNTTPNPSAPSWAWGTRLN